MKLTAFALALSMAVVAPTAVPAGDILGFDDFGCKDKSYEGCLPAFNGFSKCDGKGGRPSNDELKSLRLRNVPAGTRIVVYDSPEGDRRDDHTYIDVKRTVQKIDIGNLESTYEDDDVKVTYRRVNGLNGKVSSIRVTLDFFRAPRP